MTTSEQALRAARSASAQTTYLALNAENILLRDEISRLQAKFDIAHAALGVAVDECERLTGERDGAVKERDEWHRLAVASDRETSRVTVELANTDAGWWQGRCVRAESEVRTLRGERDALRGERDRARDLCVRSGVFTRDDDAHSEAQRSPWEGISL